MAVRKRSRKTTSVTARPSRRPSNARRGGRAPGGARSATGTLRVRMYRIGFGDFFLLTVPTPGGPQHILIDCGVHAGNIGTMDDCVKDLVKETGGKLALVIA